MAKRLTIIQIVPRRTSQPDGVSDYSTLLANAMHGQSGCASAFIAGAPLQDEPSDAWQTTSLMSRNANELAKQLTRLCSETAASAVVLHFVGYGYQKRGVPLWLLTGMRIWRREHMHIRLIGVFHELFATGRIFNSSFWLSQAQKYVTRELWRLCDRGLTTTSVYFDQLVIWRPEMRRHLKVLPVFSNVGEPSTVLPYVERPLQMAVFGRPGVEQSIYYGQLSADAARAVDTLGIQKVIDIGARNAGVPRRLGQAVVTAVGQLSGNGVSEHLLTCRFGLLNYNVGRLEKSGVFAAYAAHGVIPVCIGSEAQPTHRLEQGRHFLRTPVLNEHQDLSPMQRQLQDWYRDHSLAEHARLVNSWCLRETDGQLVNAASAREAVPSENTAFAGRPS